MRHEGFDVTCVDLSLDRLDPASIVGAKLIAFHVPMHTATRIAAHWIPRVREAAPHATLCFYGIYAPLNEEFLRKLGGDSLLGGEFETGLVALARRVRGDGIEARTEPIVSTDRQQFFVPDRTGLPGLERYAGLVVDGETRTVGYTEASRGCRHLCRHCPIVPVYEGRFRVVQPEAVLDDIRNQVAAGARHITFGDPDFLNGPKHAMQIVESLARDLPGVTYDVTIKVEHLLRHRGALDVLRDTGCLFVTSAVESMDDEILGKLSKQHTAADVVEAVGLMRRVGVSLQPTFVTFTPWTSLAGYLRLLETLIDLELVDHVAPVQYAIRLLIPNGSLLLGLDDVRNLVDEFDEEGLVYPWQHPDPQVDALFETVAEQVQAGLGAKESRREIFKRVWAAAHQAVGRDVAESARVAALDQALPTASVPYLTEPWYC